MAGAESGGRCCGCRATDGTTVPSGHRLVAVAVSLAMMSSTSTPDCLVSQGCSCHSWPWASWTMPTMSRGCGVQLCGGAGLGGIRSQERGCASSLPCFPKFLLAFQPLLGSTRGLTFFQHIPSSCFSGQSPFLPFATSNSGHNSWRKSYCNWAATAKYHRLGG